MRRQLIALLEGTSCNQSVGVNVTNIVPHFVYQRNDVERHVRRYCKTFGHETNANDRFEIVTEPSSGDTFSIVGLVTKTFPPFMTLFVRAGIVPMYIGVVLVVAKVVRSLMSSSPTEAIIRGMPNADNLQRICHDIYIVRESHDLAMEHDLYGKLVFLFRSAETLIKWTRMKSD